MIIRTHIWLEFVGINGLAARAVGADTSAAIGVLLLPLIAALVAFVLVRAAFLWDADSHALTAGAD